MGEDLGLVLRFTRNWIHYGFLAHTVACVLIAAVKGLAGA
jgi:Flp pilus assembly pilin Flp